jgi:hypothetical protein
LCSTFRSSWRTARLTPLEADKLKKLSVKSTGSLAFNILIGFGVIAVAVGAIALVPDATHRDRARRGRARASVLRCFIMHRSNGVCSATSAFSLARSGSAAAWSI